MSLAPFVRTLARGPGRSRNLTESEAAQAMSIILSDCADPEAVGALLMLMRYRGETAAEIAGFVRAMRAEIFDTNLVVDVDWPSYAAGRTRGLPLFLLSAKLIAQAGYRICIHGWNSHQNPVADVRAGLSSLDILTAQNTSDARDALSGQNLVYMPIEALSPKLLELLQLRDVLGLRSPINTALRGFNPFAAPLSVQGVFHPPYRDLQRDSAALLEQKDLLVLKGAGGEFERNPTKLIELSGLQDGDPVAQIARPFIDGARKMNEGEADPGRLDAIWSGASIDAFSAAVVIGTAALVLMRLENLSEAQGRVRAASLWDERHQRQVA